VGAILLSIMSGFKRRSLVVSFSMHLQYAVEELNQRNRMELQVTTKRNLNPNRYRVEGGPSVVTLFLLR
jgi:hypothetical protein